MLALDDLVPGILVRGLSPHAVATVKEVRRFGAAGVEVAFVDEEGRSDHVLLCREHEPQLELAADEREWSFAADAGLWRLAATAHEILVNTYPGEVEDAQSRRHLAAFLSQRGEDQLSGLVDELTNDPGFLYDSAVVPPLADLDSFFHEALLAAGGQGSELLGGRYEIAALPKMLAAPSLPKQIAFSPELGQTADADWVHVQHPLVRELAEEILGDQRSLLKQGAILVVPGEGRVRLGLLVEHGAGRLRESGQAAWRQLQRLEVDVEGHTSLSPENSWWAYRMPTPDEHASLAAQTTDLIAGELEEQALAWSVAETVPLHLEMTRRAREHFSRRLAEGLEIRGGSGEEVVRRNLLRERLREWEREPLMPLLPEIVGGALLIPERLVAADAKNTTASIRIPNNLHEMTQQVPTPGVPPAEREPSRKTEGERRASRENSGLFTEIPGLVGAPREFFVPATKTKVGPDRGDRPPVLTQSKVALVEVDLQQEWHAHEQRLAELGVDVGPGIELVRRNSVDGGMALWVPSGNFSMGERLGDRDEKPIHQVYVDAFYMDVYPVTQGQFQRFVRETGYRLGQWEARPDSDDHPVVEVSWEDAVNYCQWAGKRLPTEAEWEKAARGTDGRTYPWGEDFEPDRACVLGRGFDGTAPVGNFTAGASPYGLHDMAGNVWEWAADYYAEDYYNWCPLKNPYGPDSGERNVLRGGAWICHRRYLRCAKREHQMPEYRSRFAGFRCAS
ncbi:MAG: sulfatase activating formylglycine-generating enzyme [Candidatus Latescibacterota bacterium]|jgi:formylglycine-generating enzyme required for sulfatase activity